MRIFTVILALILASSIAYCAEPTSASTSPAVTLSAKDMPIDQVATELGKQTGIQISCDPAVKGSFNGSFSAMPLEKALDLVAKSGSLKWQKVFLAPPPAGQKVALTTIKSRCDAVAAMAGSTVVVFDPVTGKQRVFVEQDPASPAVDPAKLGLKPVYLVSKPVVVEIAKDAKAGSSSQLQQLNEQRMKLMMQLPSDQRVSAMQQDMMLTAAMDPTARSQYVLDQMNARRNMSPEQRAAYDTAMGDAYNSLRQQGLISGRTRGGPGGGGGGRRGGNRGGGG